MMRIGFSVVLFLLSLSTVQGQGPITFESIPGDVDLVSQGSEISLDGDVRITGTLSTESRLFLSADGIEFADGSVQTSAAESTNQGFPGGIYQNRIVSFTPPDAFTEVCIKQGSLQSDIHSISEPTDGGNCIPGDTGWVIERDQRSAATWEDARLDCLLSGMRLAEPFEWLISCKRDSLFGLSDMTGGFEWSSNVVDFYTREGVGGSTGVAAVVIGDPDCLTGRWLPIASLSSIANQVEYRCVR